MGEQVHSQKRESGVNVRKREREVEGERGRERATVSAC